MKVVGLGLKTVSEIVFGSCGSVGVRRGELNLQENRVFQGGGLGELWTPLRSKAGVQMEAGKVLVNRVQVVVKNKGLVW